MSERTEPAGVTEDAEDVTAPGGSVDGVTVHEVPPPETPVIQTRPPVDAPPVEAMLDRSFDVGTLRALRGAVTECVGASLADLARSEFVLAVHEIATNAVRHGGGTGDVRLWQEDGYLCCEVADRGTGIPPGRLSGHRPRPGHIGGWGLWLARQICDTVDIDTGRHGTRVRLRYPLPAAVPCVP